MHTIFRHKNTETTSLRLLHGSHEDNSVEYDILYRLLHNAILYVVVQSTLHTVLILKPTAMRDFFFFILTDGCAYYFFPLGFTTLLIRLCAAGVCISIITGLPVCRSCMMVMYFSWSVNHVKAMGWLKHSCMMVGKHVVYLNFLCCVPPSHSKEGKISSWPVGGELGGAGACTFTPCYVKE